MKLLEIRKDIANETNTEKAVREVRSRGLGQLGWMLLGGLAAGRVQSFHPSIIRPYLEAASNQPLRHAYSIVLWYIEHAVTRFAKTDHASTFIRPIFDATVVGAQLAGQIAGRTLTRLKALKHQSAELSVSRGLLVTPGSREEAIQILSKWFETHLVDFVIIADQYFSPSDLEWIQLIRTAKPNCEIRVLTGRRCQPSPKAGEELADVYVQSWRQKYDQGPPKTEIAIIGGERTGQSPIHDRWIVTKSGGLRLGTSLNSLGLNKDSEVSELSPEDAEDKLSRINEYLSREKVEYKNEKLRLVKDYRLKAGRIAGD